MAPIELERTSHLRTPAAAVWAVASTMAGVNAELGPWLRMTFPAERGSLAGQEVVAGELAFRSWLLVLGVVPFDRHALSLERVLDGRDGGPFGFDEASTSWLQRGWRHERRIVDGDGGATVTDRLVVEPRVALLRPVVRLVVGATFRHRHRRLVGRFGAA